MEWEDLVSGEVPAIAPVAERILNLTQFAVRNPEGLNELAGQVSAEPLGNVPWGGRAGAAKLVAQLAIPSDRTAVNERVDAQFQLIRQLPDDQILVGPHTGHELHVCNASAGTKNR